MLLELVTLPVYKVNNKFDHGGFTLIEVMVVIGIIGIIASIGLTNMNDAREKAYDAEVKYQLAASRRAAEIYYDTKGDYKNSNGGSVANNCNAPHSMFVDTASGMRQYTLDNNYPPGTDLRCSANNSGYAISASLQTEGEYWCVNAQGLSKILYAVSHIAAHPNNDVDCDP